MKSRDTFNMGKRYDNDSRPCMPYTIPIVDELNSHHCWIQEDFGE